MSASVAKARADAAHASGDGPMLVSPASEPQNSALATKCFHLWSQGKLSTTAMQEIALLAILDGAKNAELAELASIGSVGSQPGNCKRDFMRRFCSDNFLAAPSLVQTVFRDPKTSQSVAEPMAVFRPDHLIHSMAEHVEFDTFFGIQDMARFWNLVEGAGCPKLEQHPIKDVPNWKNITVPLWVHGDGVEFQDRDSLMVWTVGGLLSLQAALDSSLLMAATAKSCTIDRSRTDAGTWHEPWRCLKHGFDNLFSGEFSAVDFDGTPDPKAHQKIHPKGYRFIAWTIEGDHEFFSNTLKLPHWQSHCLCWNCNTNGTDDATTWRRLANPGWTLKSTEEHLARPASHSIFECPGVSTLMVANDSLHVIFNKGILSHFLGSILHIWCHDGPRIRQNVSPAARLGLVFGKIQEFWAHCGADCHQRLTNLKLSMFVAEDKPHAQFPSLHAKGAETKHLLPAMCWVMDQMDDGSDVHRHIMEGLVAINKFVIVMNSADWVPTPRESRRMLRYAERFLDNYAWLDAWAQQEERLLFHTVPKFHMFHHLAQFSEFLNPRACWCFKAEDWVGKISRIAASCIFGTKSTKLSVKLMEKYRFMLYFRLQRPLVDDE